MVGIADRLIPEVQPIVRRTFTVRYPRPNIRPQIHPHRPARIGVQREQRDRFHIRVRCIAPTIPRRAAHTHLTTATGMPRNDGQKPRRYGTWAALAASSSGE